MDFLHIQIQKCQDKNIDFSRTKRAFKMKQKTFFIKFNGLSVAINCHRSVLGHCEICLKLTSFWCLYCQFWTYFTSLSNASIVDLEQVNICWGKPGCNKQNNSSHIRRETKNFYKTFSNLKVCIKVLLYQTTILNVFDRSTVETVHETFSCDDKILLYKGFEHKTGIVNKGDL